MGPAKGEDTTFPLPRWERIKVRVKKVGCNATIPIAKSTYMDKPSNHSRFKTINASTVLLSSSPRFGPGQASCLHPAKDDVNTLFADAFEKLSLLS